MTEPTITCPHCHSEIKLAESLAAPLVAATRQQFEKQLADQSAQVAVREDAMRAKEQALLADKANLTQNVAQQVAQQLQTERARVVAEESRKAQQAASLELAGKVRELTELQAVLKANDAKLAEAQKAQADLIRKQRGLDDAKRELELTVEKRVQDGLRLKVAEKDQTIASMQKKIEELKQKAEVCILVSHALPKGVETFDLIDGVWVTSLRAALPVATLLRQGLMQVNQTRALSEGQHTKTEMVYQYLTGPRFKQRVEAIVEAFSSMQEDLNKERKAIMKQWAKRQEQIERVMGATVGMYGDLQGIAGKSLQEIEGLEFNAFELK